MDRTRRHARGLVIAIGVLAVSAGLVAAREMPAAADHGLGTAADAAGKAVPAGQGQPGARPPAAQESAAERPANHGSFVSEAAKGDTPDGYDNHGQYGSSVAKGGQGKPEAAAGGHEHAAAAPGRATSEAAKDRKGKPGS